jgi:hypothetical protein
MTARQEAGASWVQPYNAEGRRESVTNSGTGDAWAFGCDGDGIRVRQDNLDGATTFFLAGGPTRSWSMIRGRRFPSSITTLCVDSA